MVTQKGSLVRGMLAGDETAFLQKNAALLDDYFRNSFTESDIGPRIGIATNPYAIIAQGGYGRQEQCLHSDVDLLLLFDRNIPAEAEALIKEVIYPLWDIGLEIGHATRTLKDCVSLASRDFEVLTSLLDARFLCGMSPLYTTMMAQLREKVLRRHSKKIIQWLVDSNTARHERFGDSAYLLEPNLKEGQGGLRDYHTMLWIARITSDIKQPRDLEYQGLLSHDEYADLEAALAFIWNVRNRLHDLAGRKCDQLHFEHQTRLAKALGYRKADGQQPVERFLGELHGRMEIIKQQHLMFLYELGHAGHRKRRILKIKQSRVPGIEVLKRNVLAFFSPESLLENPALLIKIFEESARLKIPLSTEAKRLVRGFLHLVDDRFRKSPEVIRAFEKILAIPVPEFNVLNEMMNSGLLLALLPEMDAIVNRIQYDEYHLYPVDKHSLRAIQVLKSFGTPDSQANDAFCDDLYKELRHRKRLLWATLLHDIGKGEIGGDHARKGAVIAESLLRRLGYADRDVETIASLIENHLLLIKAATRRDINDEETAIRCARRIESVDRLKMLFLLTVADSIATGPKAWNEWTAALMRALFFKVLNIMEKGELASREAVALVEAKKVKLLEETPSEKTRQEMASLFAVMSPRYRLFAKPGEMRRHIRLFQELGDQDFIWQVDRSEDIDTRTVTVCAKDRPGLFSKIAGVFTLNGIDILDVQVFTWRNNVALDIFEVRPPLDRIFEYEHWGKAEKHLAEALAGRLDLNAALAEKNSRRRASRPPAMDRPHQINVDNDSSSFFTIIEVFADDSPGRLFGITDALYRCQLDVWVAKIATRADQIVDVFYVRDFDGQKVDAAAQVAVIETAIETVLAGNRKR
jgi:[protein-PII] uridylyltransferase